MRWQAVRNVMSVATLVGISMASCSPPGSSHSTSPSAGNDAFDGAPGQVASAGSNQWPLPGHDYNNTREAGQSPIDATSVSSLVPAWTVPMTGALTTAPLILATRIYAEDDQGSVVAIDRTTGQVVWRSKQTGFSVGPDGVAVGWGKVFAATRVGLIALNAGNGAPVWSRRLTTTATEGSDNFREVVVSAAIAGTSVDWNWASRVDSGRSSDSSRRPRE